MAKINRTFTTVILVLGAVEFFIAAAFIFSFEPDPKNAILMGYSIGRWAIAATAAACGIISLYFAFRVRQGELFNRIESFLNQHLFALRSISTLLFLIGILIIISPANHLGEYAEYFRRVRPVLIVITILPFQFFLPVIIKVDVKLETGKFKLVLATFSALVVLTGFIILTRFGIEPDTYFWNVAGVPLTTQQLVLVFFFTLLSLQIINRASAAAKISPLVIDVGIALSIYSIGVWIWLQTPMLKHFNALQPSPPDYQYFPYSDARIHDLGALSIINGYGIYFGEYTDKPLYIVLLSILHRIAGDDYNKLSLLHLYLMGLILPCLFWFGKQFHSRQLGIVIATIILIRQNTAIQLAHLLAGTNPRLLLTEIPSMLGLIILCLLAFFWINSVHSNKHIWPYAFLTGAVLGALSLIRLNPVGLLPFMLLIISIGLRKTNANWFRQILIFILGFLLILMPWILIGRDANGYPYFLVKFFDVINIRYSSTNTPSIKTDDQPYVPAIVQRTHFSSFRRVEENNTADVQSFPYFVINHSLHNAVAAFLALPDSIAQKDQILKDLINRPYLDEAQRSTWHGELQSSQVPFIVINLFLLALGIAWSWHRWQWSGIFPLWILAGYIITLGLARSSGSRYIVPIDWILFFYYAIGIITLLEKCTCFFENERVPFTLPSPTRHTKSIAPIFAISTTLILSALIPIAQIPIVTQHFPTCENQLNNPTYGDLNLIKGKAIYPYWNKKIFSFIFLTCNEYFDIAIQEHNLPIHNDEKIIIGFSNTELDKPEIIFIEKTPAIQEIWRNP